MARPTEGTFHAVYQQRYIDAASGETLAELIANHSKSLIDFITSIPEDKADYRYAEGKWTVKQLLQHLIDTERIFSYRALRFSRNDQTALAGFVAVRNATDLLLLSFTEEQLAMSGTASGNLANVNALCFIIFGHNVHHLNILKERYL